MKILKFEQLFLSCIALTTFLISGVKCSHENFESLAGEVGDAPIVNISDGSIQGITMETKTGRKYYGFTSIPFAKPPIGQLRFEKPEPPEPWSGIRKGPRDLPPCVQFQSLLPFLPNNTYGSEDCLYLSVFTPKPDKSLMLPVMFYIHGGAWRSEIPEAGNGNRSRYLLDEDIVLVVIRYRLGALGFLSTEDSTMPGNQGLKDQLMALQWVNKNIMNFGGDPTKVTLFGSSSGGASVHYLMSSPKTKNLIQGGISQSGLATTLWSFTPPGVAKYRAVKTAQHLNCPTSPSKALADCLKTKPAYDVTNCEKELFLRRDFDPVAPYMPVLEKGPDAIVTQSPYKVQVEKPWIVGFNHDEGAYKTSYYLAKPELLETFKSNGPEYLPEALMYTNTTTYSQSMSNKIFQYYKKYNLTIMWTDGLFTFSTIDLEKLSRKAPLHFYLFNHRGKVSWTDVAASLGNTTFGNLGVCHADELLYLFNYEDDYGVQKTQQDRRVSKNLIQLWTYFAKYGKARSEWPIYSGVTKQYLTIGTNDNKVDSNLWPERTAFWKSLPVRNKLVNEGL